jgi:hypothetical protein
MKKLIVLLCLIFLAAFALANFLTTTMTWYVPSNKSHSIAYGGTCSSTAFFFNESNAVIDNDVDGNANQILPYTLRTGGSACQSSSVAGVVITNNGNTSENIDANFAAALDTNVWLKVWQGTGSGCGTNGFGGWSRTCSVVSTTSPVTSAACKDFNSTNSTVTSRLVSSLPAGDTNQLCFSGEFMGSGFAQYANVTAGDHNGTFNTTTDAS